MHAPVAPETGVSEWGNSCYSSADRLIRQNYFSILVSCCLEYTNTVWLRKNMLPDKGSRDGAVVKTLAFHQCPAIKVISVSCPCSKRFFFGYSVFPLSSKTNISIPICSWWCPQLVLCAKYCWHLNKVIYLLLFYFILFYFILFYFMQYTCISIIYTF